MQPEVLFHIQREKTVAGPYDVVQMAGLLRRKIISAETMTRREGDDDWKPFSWQPQFNIAKEMPPDATSARTKALDEEAVAANAPPILLPSRETVIKVIALIAGTLAAGGGSFLLGLLSSTLGWALLIGGISAGAVAYCFMMARMFDEDDRTLLKIFFIPYYDNYYFLTNLWKYYDLLCVKSIGVAVAIGAGIALHYHGQIPP